jgi:hypothetical protein
MLHEFKRSCLTLLFAVLMISLGMFFGLRGKQLIAFLLCSTFAYAIIIGVGGLLMDKDR